MDPERLHLPIQWKAAGDGSGEIEGHAAVFGNVDLQGDVIVKGAFRKTLADWKRAKSKIPLVDGHLSSDSKSLLGSVTRAEEDAVGLKFRAAFSSDPSSQVVRTKALEGHLDGVSIGYLPMPGGVSFKQAEGGEPVRVLSEVRLLEISLTPVPANPEARLTSVKSVTTVGSTALDLDGFSKAMRAALAIEWEPARKAAVDMLVGAYQPQAAGPADGSSTATDAVSTGDEPAGDTSSTPDDAAAYALRLINPPGPRDGAPDGKPPQALADPRIPLELARQNAEADRLEREINQALGRAG